jgi:hypothetical protein
MHTLAVAMRAAPASGVGTDGTKTVHCPSSSSLTMKDEREQQRTPVARGQPDRKRVKPRAHLEVVGSSARSTGIAFTTLMP